MLTKAARINGPVIKISLVAENSQVIVDHPKAIVSKTDASKTTSYKLRSAIGSLAASKAPTPFIAIKAAPRLRSQAIFSVFAPSNSAYHSGIRKKSYPWRYLTNHRPSRPVQSCPYYSEFQPKIPVSAVMPQNSSGGISSADSSQVTFSVA